MKRLILTSLCLLFARGAFAWGQKGHDVTAYIAECRLTPEAAEKVRKALDGYSPVYIANWLDFASYWPEYAYSKTWHYLNIDEGETLESMSRNPGGDVLTAVTRLTEKLKSGRLTPEEETLSLKMLIHLVGDMHCPMHLGRLSDLGGNKRPVRFFGRDTNLHSVWDTNIPEAAHKWSYSEWQQQIDRLTDEEAAQIAAGEPAYFGNPVFELSLHRERKVPDSGTRRNGKSRTIMEYRILGRTGLRVSAVALGCEGFIHKTPEEVCADFDFAIGHGVNFIDIYSPNPELRTNIGAALEGRRGDFVIQGHLCTTWENGQYLRTRDPEKTLASFDLQLQQLRTDCLDIGMIHYVDAEADFHRVFGGEIIRIAQRLREEGRIRHIGISSHNPAVARMAVETGLVDVLMFSVNPCYDLQPAGDDVEALWAEESYAGALRNIDPDRERLYELCERTGVGIDAMKVYGGGDLLNAENSPFGKAMTPVQCIEYALTRPGVASVMVGCRTQDEIRAALDWCGASPAERDYASAMAGMERFTWEGHCMYCGHCAPCSAGIDIATVHKFHNLAVAQGEIPETVREHYAALTHHASECIGCGACETRCPFGVEIVASMRRAAERFGY